MVLNTLQCTQRLLKTKRYLALTVSSAQEKPPCSKPKVMPGLQPGPWLTDSTKQAHGGSPHVFFDLKTSETSTCSLIEGTVRKLKA